MAFPLFFGNTHRIWWRTNRHFSSAANQHTSGWTLRTWSAMDRYKQWPQRDQRKPWMVNDGDMEQKCSNEEPIGHRDPIEFMGRRVFLLPTLYKSNIFAPENGWLEDDPFLLGPGLFSGDMLVSGRVHVVDLLIGQWIRWIDPSSPGILWVRCGWTLVNLPGRPNVQPPSRNKGLIRPY